MIGCDCAMQEARRQIAELTFPAGAAGAPRIGAEVEFLALDAATHDVVSLERRLIPALQGLAAGAGWTFTRSAKGAARFVMPGGGAVAFEPGGQIEYASPPAASPGALIADLRAIVPALHTAAAGAGIELVAAGIDPFNAIDRVPLQMQSERYRRMQAYFASIGPAGVRMMRQTASIQISIDAACDPIRTWRVLNAAAPVLVAVFANSNRYAGTPSGWANYRARTWQALDPARTGVHTASRDDAGAYAEWALDAPLMFMRDADGTYLPLRSWIARGAGSPDLVSTHLSTLFPEVRPRGHFEIRSIDALPDAWLAVPILLVAGIVFDADALSSAADLLGDADPDALRRAAASGLRDPGLQRTALDLIDIALAGCARCTMRVARADLEIARGFFETFTQRGRHVFDRSERSIQTAA